jgi:hypothetical protein
MVIQTRERLSFRKYTTRISEIHYAPRAFKKGINTLFVDPTNPASTLEDALLCIETGNPEPDLNDGQLPPARAQREIISELIEG